MNAIDILNQSKNTLIARGQEYDQPQGERSMARIVAVFNAHHDTQLTEEQGWHFMQIVKDVRFFNKDTYHHDSVVDGVNYAALRGECRSQQVAKSPKRLDIPAPMPPYVSPYTQGVQVVDCSRTSGIESTDKMMSAITYGTTAAAQTLLNQSE